jgi:cell division protein FtsW (lipid II flippase)
MAGTASGVFALAVVAKKIRLRAMLVLLLIIALVGGVLYRYADRPELTRYDIRRIATDPDRFSAGRLGRAKQVIAGFYALPFSAKLFGLGFGGILTSPWGWKFEYVDNLYLSLLFKMGIVGMAFLFWVLLMLFWTLLRLRSQVTNVYYLGIINGGIAGLFASLIHNLADTLWFFPPLSANFWFLAGITMAIALIGSQETVQEPEIVPSAHQQAVRKFNLRENSRGVPVSA